MDVPAQLAMDLIPSVLAVKRAVKGADQALAQLPKGRPELAMLLEAQNLLMAVALSLTGDPVFKSA